MTRQEESDGFVGRCTEWLCALDDLTEMTFRWAEEGVTWQRAAWHRAATRPAAMTAATSRDAYAKQVHAPLLPSYKAPSVEHGPQSIDVRLSAHVAT